jgi:hypothetical protein
MELIQDLVKNLGVSEQAAKGGAGLIFKLAQDKLPAGDFSKVAGVVPGMSDLVKAAPASGGPLGGLGKLTSAIPGGAGKLGNLASLAGGFSKLGMDTGMIGKFVPIILSFVGSKGGTPIHSILEKVLK